MDDMTNVYILLSIVGIIIALVIGKHITAWYHEIEKRNRLLEAQVKLLAQIAAANNVSTEKISEIVVGAGIKKLQQ